MASKSRLVVHYRLAEDDLVEIVQSLNATMVYLDRQPYGDVAQLIHRLDMAIKCINSAETEATQ
jgi:hypothetical protein